VIPLIVGSLLAVAGVAFVLMPLLRAASGAPVNPVESAAEPSIESSAIEALREIEFDQATGKLSAEDYLTLKAQYTPKAILELRERESAQHSAPSAVKAVAVSADPAEALIASVAKSGLVCPTDGPRPESDALYCSECGRALVANRPTSAAAAR
jgi:hypothetical protein